MCIGHRFKKIFLDSIIERVPAVSVTFIFYCEYPVHLIDLNYIRLHTCECAKAFNNSTKRWHGHTFCMISDGEKHHCIIMYYRKKLGCTSNSSEFKNHIVCCSGSLAFDHKEHVLKLYCR